MKEHVGNAVVDMQELTAAERTGSDYGQISIHNNVFAIIAHETAKKVPGVIEMQGSWGDELAGIIGRKPKDKGIRVETENSEMLTIDLAVVLEYGVHIPDVCVKLQAAVKAAVEEMTGKSVYAVNIIVQSIRSADSKLQGE